MRQIYLNLLFISFFWVSPFLLKAQCDDIDFTANPESGCEPEIVQFDVSGAPDGSSFQWDFGFTTANTNEDSYTQTFSNPGEYDVTLTVTLPDNTQCSPITEEDLVNIEAIPDPQINVSEGTLCELNEEVTITDQTDNVASRTFEVEGEVYEDASQSIQHTFTSSGQKSITLQVTTPEGCQATENFDAAVTVAESADISFCGSVTQGPNQTNAEFSPSVGNLSGQTVSSYNWTFEDGSPGSSNAREPNVTFNDVTGGKDVSLQITTDGGCQYEENMEDAIVDYIEVDPETICADGQTRVTNKAADNPDLSKFSWFFVNGEIEGGDPDDQLDVSYGSPGEYDINMQYSRGAACLWNISMEDAITVEGPEANFDWEDNLACNPPNEVTLIDDSDLPENETSQFTWHILDSDSEEDIEGSPVGPSTDDTLRVNMDEPGTYDVKQIVESTNGCADTNEIEKLIVIEDPKPAWTGVPDTLCMGETLGIDNATSPPDPEERGTFPHLYNWEITHSDSEDVDLNSNVEEPSFLMDIPPGDYDIEMSVDAAAIEGCKDTVREQRAFHLQGVDFQIQEEQVDFDCSPTTYQLEADVIHNVPDVDDNDLSFSWLLETEDDTVNLEEDDYEPVGIEFPDENDKSVANITVNEKGCHEFTVLIENSYGCDRKKVSDEICTDVIPNFGFEPHAFYEEGDDVYPIYCRSDSLQLVDSSINDPDVYRWEISGGEGRIAEGEGEAEPVLLLEEDACYDITLEVERESEVSGETCISDTTKTVCMRSPDPNFSVNDDQKECAPEIFIFNRDPAEDTLDIEENDYVWDFDDGTVEENNNETFGRTYEVNNPDGFNVSLGAEDEFGCKDTLTRESYIVLEGPVPQFEPVEKTGCDELTTDFVNQSEYVDAFEFDYGDGSPSDSGEINQHTYSLDEDEDMEEFVPVMIAVGTDGCRASYSDTVTLSRTATSDFTVDKTGGCVEEEFNFEATDEHEFADYEWDFTGDGEVDEEGIEASYAYEEEGEYDVTLVVSSGPGCRDTVLKENYIEVTENAEAGFSLSQTSFCAPGAVEFENQSENFTDFTIDYGQDDMVDTNELRDFTYEYPEGEANEGAVEVEVTFRAYNDFACRDEVTETITLFEPTLAEVDFSEEVVCEMEDVTVEGSSPTADSWQWDVGINNEIDYTQSQFTFNPPLGETDIRLIASNDQCVDTIDMQPAVKVSMRPEANYDIEETFLCPGEEAVFTNQSVSEEEVDEFQWRFSVDPANEPVVTDQPDPVLYEDEGIYSTSLVVVDEFGCTDTAEKEIEVLGDDFEVPQINFASFNDEEEIEINWQETDRPRLALYELQRSFAGGEFNEILTQENREDTVYRDGDIVEGNIDFSYRLKASDQCDFESGFSDVHQPPLLDASTLEEAANILEWDPYDGWQPVFYTVERAIDGIDYEVIDTVSGTTLAYEDEDLCDENYCYRVVAHHGNGEYRSLSNPDCNNPPYQQQEEPLILNSVSVVDDQNIEVDWMEGVQDNIRHYKVDRRVVGSEWVNDYALVEDQTSFVDRDVSVKDTNYQYRVTVEDECGHEPDEPSNVGTSILLRGGVEDDLATLAWNHYRLWEGGISNYTVEIRNENHEFEQVDGGRLPGDELTFVDEEIYPEIDTSYCYRVTALGTNLPMQRSVSNVRCITLPSRMWVPSAFSPNDEGPEINNVFKPVAISVHNEQDDDNLNYEMRIFNRYGELVFETDDLNEGWDGKLDNVELAPEGVYLYDIRARGIDYEVINKEGSVTLIR